MEFPIQMLRCRSLNVGRVIFIASRLYINKFAEVWSCWHGHWTCLSDDEAYSRFLTNSVYSLQLLKEKNLMPELTNIVDDVVVALEDQLRVPAAVVAARLRNSGRTVELVLESKRLKW